MRVFSTDLEVSPGEYWDDWRRVMNMQFEIAFMDWNIGTSLL